MKTFKMFIEKKTLSRKYIAVVYDDKTHSKMRDWCIENGFDLTKKYDGSNRPAEAFEFHTTVFYAKNEINLENTVIPLVGEVSPVKFELLGENNDIPVLIVKSDDLNAIRDEYGNLGIEDEWPDYKPHISLSYDRKKYDISKLKLPNFKMRYSELKIEDIDD